jgi:hypothetical protein
VIQRERLTGLRHLNWRGIDELAVVAKEPEKNRTHIRSRIESMCGEFVVAILETIADKRIV